MTERTARDTIVIEETTPAELGGTRIGFGNVWEREVAGVGMVLAGQLFPENGEPFDTYRGLSFSLDGKVYRVLEVWKDGEGRSFIAIAGE